MDRENIIIVIYIFLLTSFFSAMSWINAKVKNENIVIKNPKIEGFTHSMTSALVAVILFAGLSHYMPDWELLLKGAVSVGGGAFLGETIIKFAERRINNA
ncbi:hypothetical protein [Caminibacter sp.]